VGKVVDHLWGRQTASALAEARQRLGAIDVDRLRVKPVVKVTGEFFAQTTEGDGNFRMFQFLEREGAEVMIEPIANWLMYLLWQTQARRADRKWLEMTKPPPWRVHTRLACEMRFLKRQWLLTVGERMYAHLYRRVVDRLGGIGHDLLDMMELARLADPYYHQFARGGEGHLEVAKNIYYTTRRAAHMVLSLKPFGCMPSTQSDGVQSAVVARYPEMLYVPVETAADGELAAHNRVQMALVEARARAEAEFERALASTGRSLAEIQAYVADHPHLRRANYHVPHQKGVAGVAAGFVLHVGRLMGKTSRPGTSMSTQPVEG
jgi:predicted nucleotide-binding protein (sugar kinase/HSP70/actin superfamily)